MEHEEVPEDGGEEELRAHRHHHRQGPPVLGQRGQHSLQPASRAGAGPGQVVVVDTVLAEEK